jgi:hypothetical protein
MEFAYDLVIDPEAENKTHKRATPEYPHSRKNIGCLVSRSTPGLPMQWSATNA